MEEHKRELEVKILELEVKLIILSKQLSKNLSDNEIQYLNSQRKLFQKEFELYDLSLKRKEHILSIKINSLIKEHIVSLELYFEKIQHKQKVFGASASEDSGKVRR